MKARLSNRRAMPWHPPTLGDSRIVFPSPAERWQLMTLCGGQRMIADNCCRKSSNRRLAPVVATGETAGVGQKRRFDPRRPVASGLPRQTDVFRDRQHVSKTCTGTDARKFIVDIQFSLYH